MSKTFDYPEIERITKQATDQIHLDLLPYGFPPEVLAVTLLELEDELIESISWRLLSREGLGEALDEVLSQDEAE